MSPEPSVITRTSGTRRGQTLTVLAHRACLDGPNPELENTLEAMRAAVAIGFSVEFDVGISTDGRLVLAHDPCPWAPARDPYPFLRNPGASACHALNVKSLHAVPAILDVLRTSGSASRFFLFDFELLTSDLAGCRFLMRSLQEQGFRVAYRLSDREPFLDWCLHSEAVREVWLDEFDLAWVTRDVVRSLYERGVQCYYVSPELHGRRDMDEIRRRWSDLADWGIGGICTDFPRLLTSFIGGAS